MTVETPMAELGKQFSSPDATPTPWAEARERLEKAEVYWLSTVRPDGRPHVTPLIAVWLDGALYFCTGADERKAKNLAGNARVILTTGCNALNEGFDLVVEGDAVQLRDEARLRRVADAYASKYPDNPEIVWKVDDAVASSLLVYEVAPKKAIGFAKGEPFSQTRWRF